MEMRVDPPRSGQFAAQIDDLRGRADESRNRPARPQRFDTIAPDGQGLDFGLFRIKRDYTAVGEDEIGRPRLLSRGRNRGGREAGATESYN